MELGDLDHDGDLDLAIVRVLGRNFGFGFDHWDEFASASVWINDGRGALRSTQHGLSPGTPEPLIIKGNAGNGMAIGDLDHDGDEDIVIPWFVSYEGTNGILRNNGNGPVFSSQFSPFGSVYDSVPALGSGAMILIVDDLDGDGRDDLIANGYANESSIAFSSWADLPGASVRLATGPGFFSRVQGLAELRPTALAAGDLNEDGLTDIVVATGAGIEIWHRDIARSRRFNAALIEPAVIRDSVVRHVIAQEVGKAAGDLTLYDLALIRDLRFDGNGLTELRLPMGLVNLETLSVAHNSITEFRLPPDITKLREFYHSNPVTGPQPGVESVTLGPGFRTVETLGFLGLGTQALHFEAEMPYLKNLGLWANRIRDFAFLAQTPNLETLNLGNNDLHEVTFPFGPRHLQTVTLSRNRVTEFKIPRGMVIDTIQDFSKDDLTYYDTRPLIQSPRLDGERGLVFEVESTDGRLQVESSTDLETWTDFGSIVVENWAAEFAVPIDRTAKHLFFRTFRRGGGG